MLTLGIQHCGTKSSQKHLIHTGYSTLRFKKYPGTACSHREFNITVQKVARYSVFIPGIQHCGSKSIQVQRVHNGYSTLWFKKYPGTIFSHRVFNTAVQFQAARYNVFTSGIEHCGSESIQVQRVLTGYSTLRFIFSPAICTLCVKHSCDGVVTSSLSHILLPVLLNGLHILLHQNLSSATYYIPPLFHATHGC